MTLRLTHLNFPARDPEGLARWYEAQLGFERRGAFVVGDATFLVFERGEPLDPGGNTHFGFHVESAEAVQRWADHFGTTVECEANFAATKVRDPEGNWFEIYWEPFGPTALSNREDR